MTKTAVLTDSKYSKLISDLKRIIGQGRKRVKEAVARENVLMYWEVGKRITQEAMTEDAGYAESIYEEIAEELDIHSKTVEQTVLFFEVYGRKNPEVLKLNWAHYRVLSAVGEPKARDWYEKKALEEGWIRNRLASAIRDDLYSEYLRAGGKQKSSERLKRPKDPSYVYRATVLDVVDGDTLLVRFDLGFTVKKDQRIRLAEIDCEEKDTKAGYKAFEFVRDTLAQVPFIVIKTNKVDVRGRYVGHVFYAWDARRISPVFEHGKYLNQELLSRGHAKPL
jgi:endonuclease YncB( thermonuclease family)